MSCHIVLAYRHYPNEDSLSMCSESAVIHLSYVGEQSTLTGKLDELRYPGEWTVDDVIKWLHGLSLQAFTDNFRKNEIDGSVLIDETDGINDDIIRQLIPPIGIQLKFRKALRVLRTYVLESIEFN
jgi:hypothetical protein